MKKVLIINCHPQYQNNLSVTVQLKKFALEHLLPNPNINVEVLDLYAPDTFIPRLDEDMITAWGEVSISPLQTTILDRQNMLIDQFVGADYVFIFSPLHNFNVTSRFKDYIDNLLIAKRTFRYTSNGSEGLLDNSKRIVYVQVSGSEYTQDMRYIQMDIAPYYVRTIFNVMGISHLDLVRVQGTALSRNNKDELVNKAKQDLLPLLQRVEK